MGRSEFRIRQLVLGRGGRPLDDYEWAINYIDDHLNETRYKMPECINQMLEIQYQQGKMDSIQNIKNALNGF